MGLELRRWWARWTAAELGVEPLRACTVIVCGGLAATLVVNAPSYMRHVRNPPVGTPTLLGLWQVPVLPPVLFDGALGLMVAGLALAAVQGARRGRGGAALVFSFFAYFAVFSQVFAHPDVARKANVVPVLLAALWLADLGGGKQARRWPLQLVHAYLALIYLDAGLEKLLRNPGWWQGDTLRQAIAATHLYWPLPWGWELAQSPRLAMAASSAVLAWELTFWASVRWRRLAVPMALFGLAFHAGTWALMDIAYLKYHGWAFAVILVPAWMGGSCRRGRLEGG